MDTNFSELVVQRFWDKVEKDENGCMIWGGARTSTGYGRYSVANEDGGRTNYRSHRFAWILTHGEIPRNREICHRCDVRLCVNLDHLFLGTHRDNMLDAQDKGRLVVPESPNKHRTKKRRLRKGVLDHTGALDPDRMTDDEIEIVPHEYAPSEMEDFGNDEAGPEDRSRGDGWRWEELFD